MMFSFDSNHQSTSRPNRTTATPLQVQLRNNIIDKLSFTSQRPKPSRLESAPAVMVFKKLNQFERKYVLNSRGTLFDVERSQRRRSKDDQGVEPMTIHIQNPSLLPALSTSEKKNRRKMVMRPLSCEMFWDEEFNVTDVCSIKDTINQPSALVDESKAASISIGSVERIGSEKHSIPQRLVRPALFSTNSMYSTFSESHGSSSTTPLTTPGSRGMETRTPMAGGYTPSGLKNSSDLLTPRLYLRPQMLRFGSLPMISNQLGLSGAPESEGRRPRPSLGLQPRRTTFSGMRPGLPRHDFPQSRDGLPSHPTSNYPKPGDTKRFGLALMSGLKMALDDMEREASHEQEVSEMEQSSYGSTSETEEDGDAGSCYDGDLLELYHPCV